MKLFDEDGMLITKKDESLTTKKHKKKQNTMYSGYTEIKNGTVVYKCGSCHKTIGSRPLDTCTNKKHWDLYIKRHGGKIPNKRGDKVGDKVNTNTHRTLYDFEDTKLINMNNNSNRKIESFTKKEWSIADLPEEVRIDPIAFVQKCKMYNFSDDIKKLIDLIEHGSADLKKKQGAKSIVIAKGLPPYTPYLLWNLYKIYKKYRDGKIK